MMRKGKKMNSNREIKVMIFEPGKEPYTAVLEDSLEHHQTLVGGEIECISLPHETVLCCNAAGKWLGLPVNRPDCAEDLLEDEIIRDDLRSLPKSDRVYAEVGTYLYGEGETERASEEELAYFSKNFEELYASVQVDWVGGHSFGFAVEDVLPDYTDEPEPELEDEDDLEL